MSCCPPVNRPTAALLAMMLKNRGYRAQSMLGHQAEVVTDSAYGNARILEIGAKQIAETYHQPYHRRGSRLSGLRHQRQHHHRSAGAARTHRPLPSQQRSMRMFVKSIPIVNGIYTADPNICPKSAQAQLDLIRMRCSTWPAWAPRYCRSARWDSPKSITSPYMYVHLSAEEEGTMVVNEDSGMEQLLVFRRVARQKSGPHHQSPKCPTNRESAAKIFSPLSRR